MPNRTRKPLHVFSGILYESRRRSGLTQQNVADFLECSRRWYQKIESGTSKPNWQDALLLAALFHLDPEEVAKEIGFDVPIHTHSK